MTATAAGRKQIKHRIIKTFLTIMRTTIYKTASAVILLLTIIIPAYAQQETTLIMKNGSKITGNIVVQRPGKDITIEATEALLVVSDGEIKSKKDKYVRYEKTSARMEALGQWKTKGSAGERRRTLSDDATA